MPQICLVAVLAAAMAAGVAAPDAEESPAPAPAAKPAVDRMVWTNDHLEQRFRPSHPEPFAPEPAEPVRRRYVREEDPAWYRARLAPLEEELAEVQARAARIRQFLAAPRDFASPGLVLRQRPMRLSPENELALIAARRAELAARIGAIQDEARRHWLSPGAVR
jgi:hypothetical protein